MNLLFFAVFLLFSLLVLRLGLVQIVNGESYKKEVERTEDVVVNTGVPRGKMYDRYGNVIVDNVPLNAITYTRANNTKVEEMLEVAERLSDFIQKDTKEVTERDKKDYWILNNKEEADKKVSEEEIKKLQNNEELSEDEVNAKVYQLRLERITEEDLDSLTEKDLEIIAIYREFSSGYALNPQIVKNEGVTPEEFAVVSEHLSELPGVNTTTDWKRSYVFDDTLRTILGNVSSSREGLPVNLVDSYLAKDYNRNDRVGKSYVELQYEDVLQGQKEQIKNVTKGGSVLESILVQEGQRGKDIVLTIDMELQREVEKIIEEELRKQIVNRSESPNLDRAYVVMIDPNTGEILAMAGKQYVKNSETGKYEMRDAALGTFTSSYEVGSVVKGATVLTGYMTGNLTPGEVLVDEPIKIGNDRPKTSWFNRSGRIPMTDLFALEKSSNSYMWKIAFRIAGREYIPNETMINNPQAFDVLRNHYAQFGLGVPTGIDLPGESSGLTGTDTTPGFLLDLAIGQFDTYTTMQLAQYISTIANDGYRVEPHIMKEIREPTNDQDSLGPILFEKETNVLNRIGATQAQIEHVQKGFYRVYHYPDGTAYSQFKDAPYNAAGKSGTAETYVDGELNYNTTLIGYAPFDQPEVAYATMVPSSHIQASGVADPYVNKYISKRVMDKYFELKKKRAKEVKDPASVEKKVENAEEAEEQMKEEREENN
ncbi:penicillin-binding protein 2 [Rossellomorea sp. AcN35-11]|nr:penicillin-binding protein 2 [Rossellomorea aquimaris]NMH69708.1 penicillin-binding protein 2 [Bacillus sp. RO3]WJV31561.1 penicillin-binding protein 2 [Rossellomorea sp. AcN35-11]